MRFCFSVLCAFSCSSWLRNGSQRKNHPKKTTMAAISQPPANMELKIHQLAQHATCRKHDRDNQGSHIESPLCGFEVFAPITPESLDCRHETRAPSNSLDS